MPASLNAYFKKLDDQIVGQQIDIAFLRRTVDSLSTVVARMTSEVSDLQQRLDDQEARRESQSATRKQRKSHRAPPSGD